MLELAFYHRKPDCSTCNKLLCYIEIRPYHLLCTARCQYNRVYFSGGQRRVDNVSLQQMMRECKVPRRGCKVAHHTRCVCSPAGFDGNQA